MKYSVNSSREELAVARAYREELNMMLDFVETRYRQQIKNPTRKKALEQLIDELTEIFD